jgi:hypothetical protein
MQPDVDRRWQELEQTFSGLQRSLRLPVDAELHDLWLDTVRQYLIRAVSVQGGTTCSCRRSDRTG